MHSFFWSWKALLSHTFTKKDRRIYCDRKSSWGMVVFIASWIIYNTNVTVEDCNIWKGDSSFRCHLYMISSNVNKNTENFCLDESWVHNKYSELNSANQHKSRSWSENRENLTAWGKWWYLLKDWYSNYSEVGWSRFLQAKETMMNLLGRGKYLQNL